MAHSALLDSWTAEQHRQRSLAVFTDSDLDFAVHAPAEPALPASPSQTPPIHRLDPAKLEIDGLHTVAGLDISFPPGSDSGDEGIAVLAVLSFPDLKPLHTLTRRISLSSTPYIHSYLSFREADHYVALVDELRAMPGARMPQVLFVDGNGRWHPREAGSAVAVGVKTGIPTVGVAKEYHPITSASSSSSAPSSSAPASTSADPPPPYPLDFRFTQKGMRKACQHLLQKRGDWLGLVPPDPALPADGGCGAAGTSEDYWGAALLSSPSKTASNPVFISPGHRLSLETCVALTLACCRESKVPEPVRRADAVGREEARRIWGGAGEAG
ncbi:hypothetical protein JCM8097_007912 [Rhodosporidiobolus ruineniae]